MWKYDSEHVWTAGTKSAFTNGSANIPRLGNCLLGLTSAMVLTLLEGRTHELIDYTAPGSVSSMRNKRLVALAYGETARPQIYVLTHCEANGDPPTKREYLDMLIHMKRYITVQAPEAEMLRHDVLAEEIDEHSPAGRDWSAATRGRSREVWECINGKAEGGVMPHARRYCHSNTPRASIREFIVSLEARLAKIAAVDIDKPLPWSLAYVGWTKSEDERIRAHYAHDGTGNSVKL